MVYNEENVRKILESKNLKWLDENYVNCKSKLLCETKEKYKVLVILDKLVNRSCYSPSIFHKTNPYSVYNINIYCKNNDIESVCISETYDSKKLLFKCKCGNNFTTTSGNFMRGKQKCDICSNSNTKNKSYEEIKKDLLNKGYNLLTLKEDFINATNTKLECEDSDGYKFIVDYSSVVSTGKGVAKFRRSNPYTIYNINHYLNITTNGKYQCISNKYENKKSELKILHKSCGRTFITNWNNLYKNSKYDIEIYGTRCPFCEGKRLESAHALILKQVWLHEKPNTIVEDKSCINPNTNMPLPTDIVNHDEKIAIEIQSWFHDFEKQKEKDCIKKKFWIDKGYTFFAIDHRDYSILEMIQIFFPHIDKIPQYIDFEYTNKVNVIKMQELLNKGLSINKVAVELGCNVHNVYDSIHVGKVELPINYKNESYTQIVQLDLNGNFINKFNSIKEASNILNLSSSAISQCMQKGRNYSSGYLWFYAEDYYSGNFNIPTTRQGKFKIPVDKYDLNGNFIKSYDTILIASKENGCVNQDILDVMNGKRKRCRGYMWKYPNKK